MVAGLLSSYRQLRGVLPMFLLRTGVLACEDVVSVLKTSSTVCILDAVEQNRSRWDQFRAVDKVSRWLSRVELAVIMGQAECV